ADPALLVGTITNRLPVELKDAALFFRGRWVEGKSQNIWKGLLSPKVPFRIDDLHLGKGEAQNEWLNTPFDQGPAAPGVNPGRGPSKETSTVSQPGKLMKSIFFPTRQGVSHANDGLRWLDESWRIGTLPALEGVGGTRYRDEVILVARVTVPSGAAETVAQHGASAARLWLGGLPRAGKQRPPLKGFLSQETYVRVYIPIKK